MKRGFTLIELLVVVGLMAMLGVAATGGYAALQRGMAERGATAAVNALLKSAKERAKVDRVPTMVLCYNRMLRAADDENNAVIVGEAIAIRRSGRISFVRGKFLYDEFADLERTYESVEKDDVTDRAGMKLWHFDPGVKTMSYSLVADAVSQDGGINAESFADDSGTIQQVTPYAFYKLDKPGHNDREWVAGSGYGFEFAHIQLPHNFIFKQQAPSDVSDIVEVGAFYFDPANDSNESIDIYYCKPDASGVPRPSHKAGQATSKENAVS